MGEKDIVYVNGKPSLTAFIAKKLDELNGTNHSKLFEKKTRKELIRTTFDKCVRVNGEALKKLADS